MVCRRVCVVCQRRGKPGVSLHRFPPDQTLQKRWLQACGFEKLPWVDTRICSRHFNKKCFIKEQPRGAKSRERNRLRKGAIPFHGFRSCLNDTNLQPTVLSEEDSASISQELPQKSFGKAIQAEGDNKLEFDHKISIRSLESMKYEDQSSSILHDELSLRSLGKVKDEEFEVDQKISIASLESRQSEDQSSSIFHDELSQRSLDEVVQAVKEEKFEVDEKISISSLGFTQYEDQSSSILQDELSHRSPDDEEFEVDQKISIPSSDLNAATSPSTTITSTSWQLLTPRRRRRICYPGDISSADFATPERAKKNLAILRSTISKKDQIIRNLNLKIKRLQRKLDSKNNS